MRPPPSTLAQMSHEPTMLTASSGAETALRSLISVKNSSTSRLLMRILPVPGRIRTRATAFLRRPVPQMYSTPVGSGGAVRRATFGASTAGGWAAGASV